MKKHPQLLVLTLSILILTITGCEKKEETPEHKYSQFTGDYKFIRVHYSWSENTGMNSDTTYYDGFIQALPDDIDKVVIKCGDGTMGSHHSEYFSTVLKKRAEDEYPWFGGGSGTSYFYGSFKTPDSLVIQAHWGGHGGGTGWNYYGKMTRKW